MLSLNPILQKTERKAVTPTFHLQKAQFSLIYEKLQSHKSPQLQRGREQRKFFDRKSDSLSGNEQQGNRLFAGHRICPFHVPKPFLVSSDVYDIHRKGSSKAFFLDNLPKIPGLDWEKDLGNQTKISSVFSSQAGYQKMMICVCFLQLILVSTFFFLHFLLREQLTISNLVGVWAEF